MGERAGSVDMIDMRLICFVTCEIIRVGKGRCGFDRLRARVFSSSIAATYVALGEDIARSERADCDLPIKGCRGAVQCKACPPSSEGERAFGL